HRDRKEDDDAGYIDQGGNEWGRAGRGVESDPPQGEGEHTPGQGAEENNADQAHPNGEADQKVMRAIVEEAGVLPGNDAHEPDQAEPSAENEPGADLAAEYPPPIGEIHFSKRQRPDDQRRRL